MAAGKSRAAAGRRRSLPLWVPLLLLVAVGGLLWIKTKLGTGAHSPNPRSLPPPASLEEPAPFPETPPEERQNQRLQRRPRPAPGVGAPPAPDASEPLPSGPLPIAPVVAIVLDDVGYRLDLVQLAADVLPPEVTYAVLPHLPATPQSVDLLHGRGLPLILHAPMEPLDGERWKPGGGALLVGMTDEEVRAILSRNLSAVRFAEGVNNHMGSRATTDAELMASVMAFLKGRGLYFLDSRTTAQTLAYEAARGQGLPAAQRAVFLDDTDEPSAIMEQMDLLAERSYEEGPLVGIGHVRPNTIDALSRRMPYWRAMGVRFARLREVVR